MAIPVPPSDLKTLPAITCALFDLDGTLIDTVDLIHRSFDHAVRTVLGRELSRTELLQNMGRPLAAQMEQFSKTKAAELLDVYTEHNLAEHDKHVSRYPGTVETLEWLRRDPGLPLGIVTSKKRDLCLRGLDITGLGEFFSTVVAMEDTIRHKPDPEPVLTALKQLHRTPAQAIFVGDSPFDITAGNEAGLMTGAALWGPFDRDLLRAARPDFELEKITDLRRILV